LARFFGIFDFLKGLFVGVLVGITTNPMNSKSVVEDILRKKQETAAEDARGRSETGLVPQRKQ
jgi:hypothetical protein